MQIWPQYRTARVVTDRGPVVGFRNDLDCWVFRNIPYAAPPVGPLRFAAPQPPPRWADDRDASTFGPTCVQRPPMFRGPTWNYRAVMTPPAPPGDDVLNLNVTTPEPGGRLPVMVFIHGGAFVSGAGSLPMYEGKRLAARGVVLVTINYRVGAEGFLAVRGGAANPGLQDQIAALKWVQRNIELFGGDPDRVTIFGESAGAGSVALLHTAPAAQGLFHRAISQSGTGVLANTTEQARDTADRVAALLGTSPDLEGVRQVEPLRLLEACERVGAADTAGWQREGPLVTMPWTDGEVLPADPTAALASGQPGVATLWGFNSDEGHLFLMPGGVLANSTAADLAADLAACPQWQPVLDAVYGPPGSGRYTPGELMSWLLTWRLFVGRTLQSAIIRSEAGQPSWLYEFSYDSPAADGLAGAAHMMELPFVFDCLDNPHIAAMVGAQAPTELAEAMAGQWVEFATTGRVGWPQFRLEDQQMMVLDRRCHVRQGTYRAAIEALPFVW